MVAETLTADKAQPGVPVTGEGHANSVKCAYGTFAVAANVEDGDIFEMCKVPAGARIVGGYMMAEDLDTGAETIDLDLGWAANGTDAADPDGLGNFGVLTGDVSVHMAVAGVYMPLQGLLQTGGPKKLSAETTIQVEANAVAATFAAGQLSVVIYYILDR